MLEHFSLTVTHNQLALYLFNTQWGWKIGGWMGLHTNSTPRLWDGSRYISAVPGVGYKIVNMSNDTPIIHKPNWEVLMAFLKECDMGTTILQQIESTKQPASQKGKYKQDIWKYINIWVKSADNTWSYGKQDVVKGADRTPWGADPS